jgi:hypothetical protein
MSKTIVEQNSVPVYDECGILVVGGGSAGHSAAMAAARAGAKDIIIMERYGYMGGNATGGYVIMVPDLSWYNKSFVRGLQEEWFTRMEHISKAVRGPKVSEVGSEDPLLVDAWKNIHDCVSRSAPHRLVRAVYFEPNQLKIEMDKMLLEEKDFIKVLYHSWGTKPIMEGNTIRGVFFESKEGRKAILAKVVVDATGDGDLFSQSGAPFFSLADAETRSSTTALVWRVGGIDWDEYCEWKRARPELAAKVIECCSKIAGFRSLPLPTNQNDICWVNNWHAKKDCTKIADLTATEITTRNTLRELLDYLKTAIPCAFRHAYLYDIAPQTGLRCSRRLKGAYVMTAKDFAFASRFDDVIAWHSTICQINDCGPVEIPYRAIVPQHVENMLCPGRHLSADEVAIDWLNLIPQCVGTGQAAGVAAAVAVADGASVRDVDIKKVQDILVEQDVPLPRHPKTDPSYTECCEAHQYGLYTELAQKARAEADSIGKYRQW